MRAFLVVLDGVGVGELPDADQYGDRGSNTMLHVAQTVGGLKLPNMERLGLGHVLAMPGVRPIGDPQGGFGRLTERSSGKDSTTGHWELAGLVLDEPFPTYPKGFPDDVLDRWCQRIGRGWLGNKAASGTAIVQELGDAHRQSGKLIVYTSADSVFQVAAHTETVPLEELYEVCRIAREQLQGRHGVGRVIARPFHGESGSFERISAKRRDFSLPPPADTLLDTLVAAGHPVTTVGKVDDLFAKRGVTDAIHTKDNAEGQDIIVDLARASTRGLIFVNLVDFDSLYGHRNKPEGFARALEAFDDRLPEMLEALRSDDLFMITADHGNDPTTPSTDHSREYTPLLVAGSRVREGVDLGTRETFADVAATLAERFEVKRPPAGRSFLKEIRA